MSSPNSALSHTGSVRFDITALSFGIFCLFQWKIQTTSIYLKLTSRDGATVNNVLHLRCFENHVSRLPAFPLYQIRAHGGATMIYFYFIRELQIHIYSCFFFLDLIHEFIRLFSCRHASSIEPPFMCMYTFYFLSGVRMLTWYLFWPYKHTFIVTYPCFTQKYILITCFPSSKMAILLLSFIYIY